MDISRSNDTVLIRNKMRINRMFFIFLSDVFLLSYSMICRGARTFGIDSRARRRRAHSWEQSEQIFKNYKTFGPYERFLESFI